jgi:hypothetical protein
VKRCVRCGAESIRTPEAIGEERYFAPTAARTEATSPGMRWVMLETTARRIADEIRGVCGECHLALNNMTGRAAGKEESCRT